MTNMNDKIIDINSHPKLSRLSRLLPANLGRIDEVLVTTKQAASCFEVSTRSIRRRIAQGTIPATKNSGIWWIRLADLDRKIREHIVREHEAAKLQGASKPRHPRRGDRARGA